MPHHQFKPVERERVEAARRPAQWVTEQAWTSVPQVHQMHQRSRALSCRAVEEAEAEEEVEDPAEDLDEAEDEAEAEAASARETKTM